MRSDELKGRFWAAVKKFTNNPFDQQLKTHKLTGKLQGLWAFSVDYNCRVIFRFLGKNEVLLTDIGGHLRFIENWEPRLKESACTIFMP